MAFTGRATYDSGIFEGIAEDVSDIISMISPTETKLLDALGDPAYPAANVLHEWLEEELTPDTITTSGTMINSTNELSIAVHANGTAVGNFITVGALLKHNTTGEYMQVTASSGNTITVSRAFGGTTIATVAAGTTLTLISPVALEGADVDNDVSRPRSRVTNYCQMLKKDIIISGTVQAVSNIGVEDEMQHQIQNRSRELLRDLEKVVILGKLSTNTLGSSSAYRTMKGLWDFVSTNSTSVATLTATVLDDIVENAWGYGASDLDLIVADASWKRLIDGFNTSRTQVENRDELFHERVSSFAGTFGEMPVIMSRYMPNKSVMVLSTQRIKVVPLKDRSFHYTPVSRTGDATKGMVVGEYTLEVRNEKGLAKAYG